MIKVIVVEDHRLFRVGIRAIFNAEHSDISIAGEAENAAELFALLPSTDADVVLLDIILPDMGGTEIVRRIRKDYPSIKILAVSCDNSAETIQTIVEAGIDGFVSKQNSCEEELVNAIHAVNDGSEYFGRDIAAFIYGIYVSKKKTTQITKEFTDREREIILACREGLLCKEIADKMGISVNTINTHKKRIFQKLGINNTMEMVYYAMKNGIISLLFLVLFVSCSGIFTDKSAPLLSDSEWSPSGNVQLDSLLQIAATAPRDTNLANLYYQIGEMYEDRNNENAKTYYQKSKNLSEQLNYKEGTYLYAIAYGNLTLREGKPDSAVMLFQKAYQVAERDNNEAWRADLSCAKGNAYFIKDWNENALQCYLEALSIYELKNDTLKLQNLYWLMTLLYHTVGVMEKAVEYGEKSIALNNDNPYSYLCMAIAYQTNYQREKSIGYYEEALRLSELQNNIYLTGMIYSYLANDALMVFDLDRAEKCISKAIEFNNLLGPLSVCQNNIFLSRLEELKGNHEKSKECAEEAQRIAIEFDALDQKKIAYLFLTEITYAHRKYGKNTRYFVEWDLFDIAKARGTAYNAADEMLKTYIMLKKDTQIELQEQLIARQNMQRRFLFAGIAICMVVLALLWFVLRQHIRHNRELAEMNATKDKFFNIISHDIKNPAIAQREVLQVLVKNVRSWNIDMLADHLDELLKSAEAEVELILNLLNWSQLQTGRITYVPEPFLLSNLNTNLSLIQKMAENKSITLNISIPDDAFVIGDGKMLTIVVRNLLTNAVKFTNTGGTVSLCVDSIANGKYTVSINDNGTGMAPEQIQNLFRLKSTYSQRGTAGEQGSGLGLIICKEFLEKHGSTLHIESEAGNGSRFWFEI